MEKKQKLIYIFISFLLLGIFMYFITISKGERPYWGFFYMVWFFTLFCDDLLEKTFVKLQVKMEKKYVYVLSLVLQVIVMISYTALINL